VHSPEAKREAITWAVMLLVKEGFVVEPPGRWETRREFCARLGISVWRFKRRMRYTKLRPQVDLDVGPSGRLLRLRSNRAFDRWMAHGSRKIAKNGG